MLHPVKLMYIFQENVPTCSFHENANDPEVELYNDTSVQQDELIAAEALCEMLQAGPSHKKCFHEISVQVDTHRLNTVCDLIDSDSKLNSFTGLPNMKLLEKLGLS